MKITSLQNDKVKFWCSLQTKKGRDKNQCFLIEGDHLIKEAEKRNLIIETISINNEDCDYFVSKEIMKKISKQDSISNNIAVVKFLKEKEILGKVLILDNIQDPGNLGTIIRSAVAFGFETIILSDDSVDLYNSKVIRSTEGMIFNTNIIRKNLVSIIPVIKEKGYKLVGTDVKKGNDIRKLNSEKLAIVIGNEGNGIKKDILNMCDEVVTIKINSNCESLNAGCIYFNV